MKAGRGKTGRKTDRQKKIGELDKKTGSLTEMRAVSEVYYIYIQKSRHTVQFQRKTGRQEDSKIKTERKASGNTGRQKYSYRVRQEGKQLDKRARKQNDKETVKQESKNVRKYESEKAGRNTVRLKTDEELGQLDRNTIVQQGSQKGSQNNRHLNRNTYTGKGVR